MTTAGDSSSDGFAEQVRSWGAGVVESYLQTRGRNDAARSVKSLIEETAGEYGGRFFVELLQNAHDAHPAGCVDGRVLMLLDETEGPHGTVYAADGGAGFTYDNFRAISNLALSNKPVGEGIGNKGIGFKSVLQVCESPEIYSCDPTDPARDGFCFRFADREDLRALVPGDVELEWVIEDVSRYTVPVPVDPDDIPATVRTFRNEGFSTVLRLPLRSAIAAAEAAGRFEELGASSLPVVLFLTRISGLALARRTAAGTVSQDLVRHTQPLPLGRHAPQCELVSVGRGHEFLVVSRDVDPDRLRTTLHEAVSAELLKEKWLKWEAPAHVALAVPYGWSSPEGRLYTHLPMGGEARSPILGHLHAPFFTDYSRNGMDWTHPLNSMLLDAAGELAVDAAQALLEMGATDPSEADKRNGAAVDLVSWHPSRCSHLPMDATTRGVLPGRGRPLAMRAVTQWPEGAWDILTAELAERAAGLDCLAAGLGDDRVARMQLTMSALGEELLLPARALADAVEEMAAACLHDGMTVSGWELLYDDLSYLFSDKDAAKELAGRRILLADDMTLRPCGSGAAGSPGRPTSGKLPGIAESPTPAARGRRRIVGAAFFPPVRQRTEGEDDVEADVELNPPASLRAHLFFMHPDLNWHDENRIPTRARELLQNNRLVTKFDAHGLADHVRAVVTVTANMRTHRDAMRFLFNLQRSRPQANLQLGESGLRVPTFGGASVPASAALFSKAWPGTHGTDLETVASAPQDLCPELAALRGRLLAPPEALLAASDDVHVWAQFLRQLGVGDALPVSRLRDIRRPVGGHLRRDFFASTPRLPGDVAQLWVSGIDATLNAAFRETPYRALSALAWLPGQGTFDDLPVSLKAAYARLLVAGLATWPDDHFRTVWERDRDLSNKDAHSVMTPLAAFVARGHWLSAHDPATRTDRFAAPSDCWHFQAGTDTEPPRFAGIVTRPMRAILDQEPAALQRLRNAGMGVWNSPADAPRLVAHLGLLMQESVIDHTLIPQLQNAYRSAWAAALGRADTGRPSAHDYVLVRSGDDLAAGRLSEFSAARPIVVTEESDDAFLRGIAADFRMPVLQLDSRADTACERLSRQVPGSAVRPTELGLHVQLDGQDFTPSASHTALLDVLPWLRPLLMMIMEHRTLVHERPGESSMRQFAERIAQVRLVAAARVEVRMAAEVRPLPARMRGVMPVPHPKHPTLALRSGSSDELSWDIVEALADPLMELLDYPRAATELKLALSRLRRSGHRLDQHPHGSELADACDIDQGAAERTLQRLGSGLQATLSRLHPVLAHFWGASAKPFAPPSAMRTDDELDRAVATAAAEAGTPADRAQEMLALARSADSLDELRRQLDIGLADINAVLAAQDPPQPPIDYGPRHAEAFELAVLAEWPRLLDRLRWAHDHLHRRRCPLPNWAALRSPSTLAPDPAWSLTRDAVTDEELIAEAHRQLQVRLGRPLPEDGPGLPPLPGLRHRNRSAAESALLASTAPVHAWCRKNGSDIPAALADPLDVRPALDLLDQAGVFDFRVLDGPELLAWVDAVGIWPARMPCSVDLADLGLEEADLDKAKSEEERARQRKQQERRTVEVNGKRVDVGVGYAALCEQLRASLDNSIGFLKTPARNASLSPAPPTGSRGGGERTGRSGTSDRASDVQLNAIGFAGEWLAFQWLLRQYPSQVTEECWKSRNRVAACGGDFGDDSLGFDFAVPFKNGTVMYEVKATTSDGGQVQLGESEVLAAQANARNGRWRLLVVTNVMAHDRRLRQLRNPFDPRSRGEYTFAGQGLRLLYRAE